MYKRALYRAADERGASLIEFAVTVPVLVMLVLGMMRFGITYNNQIMLTDAVRAGARYLSVVRGDNTDVCGTARQKIVNAAPNLTPASIGLTLTLPGVTKTGTGATIGSCSNTANLSTYSSGSDVVVSATYPCKLQVMGITFGPSTCTLSSRTTARVE